MRKKYEKRNTMAFLTFFIIITTIYNISQSISKYIETIEAESNLLAVPVLTLSNQDLQYEITNMLPGQTREYTFSVSNVDGEKTNEILLNYYFEIFSETENPLTIKIYKITEQGAEELEINEGKTESIEIGNNTEVIQDYKIEVIWDKSNNDVKYANTSMICNIKLQAEQI